MYGMRENVITRVNSQRVNVSPDTLWPRTDFGFISQEVPGPRCGLTVSFVRLFDVERDGHGTRKGGAFDIILCSVFERISCKAAVVIQQTKMASLACSSLHRL